MPAPLRPGRSDVQQARFDHSPVDLVVAHQLDDLLHDIFAASGALCRDPGIQLGTTGQQLLQRFARHVFSFLFAPRKRISPWPPRLPVSTIKAAIGRAQYDFWSP
ncbi:hypothetical protein [Burkholderia ubonensis]|uniref:hypothetical protein n=1 Tax=Burkholderia ubonensis TaxID=101571 RepID=UPI000A718EF5